MIRILSVAAILAVGATAVWAQNLGVVKERREAMRKITAESRALSDMSKGETPFDQAKAQAALKSIEVNVSKFKSLFPENSKTGGGTDASPKIWSERKEFEAVADKWVAVIKSASAAIKDAGTLKDEYAKVSSGCGGCHKPADGFAPRVGDLVKKPAP